MCLIASNGVPPSVSKRFILSVQCKLALILFKNKSVLRAAAFHSLMQSSPPQFRRVQP